VRGRLGARSGAPTAARGAPCLLTRASAQGHPPRPLAAVVRHNVWRQRRAPASAVAPAGWELKVDARFHCAHDAAALRGWLAQLRCHAALLFGTRSHAGAVPLRGSGSPAPDAAAREAAALAATLTGAASTALLPLQAGHYLLEDAALPLRDALAACLARWAAAGALDAPLGTPRTPETLGLRALPVFDSLEDAQRALRPRAVPTRAVIEAALNALAAEAGGPPSDDDEEAEQAARRGTALSHQPREYFGFVG
jgi:hypothetical protein